MAKVARVDSRLDRFGLGMGKVLPTLETIARQRTSEDNFAFSTTRFVHN